MQEQLGKGHFASVYLCVEKTSGTRFAVKKFEKRAGPGEKSKIEGLQQEIAVLMGVSHPALLCLKDTFEEDDGTYLVLELATEGELFNWIVMKQKLSEQETRKAFVQLFQAVKYLVRVLTMSCLTKLTLHSMKGILCIEISSQRTFSLPIRTCLSSWLILALQRSLAKNPSRPLFAVHHHVSQQ